MQQLRSAVPVLAPVPAVGRHASCGLSAFAPGCSEAACLLTRAQQALHAGMDDAATALWYRWIDVVPAAVVTPVRSDASLAL